MNTGVHRQTLLLGVLLVALSGAALWAWSGYADARRAAALADEDATASRRLAEQITASSSGPRLAAATRPNLELSTQIQRAAAEAGLPGGAVERIGVEQQRRLDADTSERSRQLSLRDVTLPRLADFLQTLAAGANDLRVSSLRLTAPRGEEAGDRWNAEITLAYRLFDPADAPRR